MTLRNRTMRDLITKLELVLFETALNPKNPQSDYAAKKKALHDLEMDPVANKDPEISKAIAQRKADLEKEASGLGVKETSVLEKSLLIFSSSNTSSYGTFASANKTFICPGILPATG